MGLSLEVEEWKKSEKKKKLGKDSEASGGSKDPKPWQQESDTNASTEGTKQYIYSVSTDRHSDTKEK
jgi:hypothetical protein